MEKQRQSQVSLLRHSRIKPTSSLNQMSVEESSPPSVQRHSSNGKRGAKGGAHSSSGSMDATSPTHINNIWVSFFFLNQPNQLNQMMLNIVFWFCPGDAAAALPHWPDLEADRNQLPPGIDVDDLQAFVTLYRDHCEVHNQTKNHSHWHHFVVALLIFYDMEPRSIVLFFVLLLFDLIYLLLLFCLFFVSFPWTVHTKRPCWTPSSACSSTRWKRSGATFGAAPTTTRPSTSVWKKILKKSCQSMLKERFIEPWFLVFFLLVREREKRVGPDGRAANSLKHKNFDDDNVIYLFFFPPFFGGVWFGLVSFLLSFPRAKLYVLSRCETVLIFVKKADYSSSIRIWSKCSYRTSSRKSLDRSPVPYAVSPNRWRIGFWRPWTAVQRISSYCQSLRNKKKLNPENG